MAKKQNITRINLNLANELLKKVDEYGEKLTVNRTVAVTLLLQNALNTEKAMEDVSELVKLVNNNQALLKMKGDEQ